MKKIIDENEGNVLVNLLFSITDSYSVNIENHLKAPAWKSTIGSNIQR